MRKMISLILALLLVFSLAACGSTNESGGTDTPTSTPATDSQLETNSGDNDPQIEVEPREFKKTATIPCPSTILWQPTLSTPQRWKTVPAQ